MNTYHLKLPLAASDISLLHAGDEVYLSGSLYTCRDAGHKRLLQALNETGNLPFNLKGQTIFYAGPTPAVGNRPLGSIGPTTASRMDFATPALMDAGLTACIGKGKRNQHVIESCQRNKSVYFACVGGIAALLATCVKKSTLIAWEDLGTEALRKLEVVEFPCIVGIDIYGNDIYREVEAEGN